MPIELIHDKSQPINLSGFSSADDGVVTVDLGDNPDNGYSYSLFATLQPCPWGIPATMEFAFWIADYDPQTRHMDKIWSGSDTKHLLVGQDREFVLFLVIQALLMLADRFKPESIFFQTFDPNLPDKALSKYHMLGAALEHVGYKFWRLSPHHGYEAWKAELKTEL